MKCAELGSLRAYLDAELPADEQETLNRHLAECPPCSDLLAEVRETAVSVSDWLAVSIKGSNLSVLETEADARRSTRDDARLHRSLSDRLTNWLAPRNRRLSLGLAAAALLTLTSLSPVRLAASDFLGVFRVQKFAAITISPDQLPVLPNPGKLGDVNELSYPRLIETSDPASHQIDFTLRRPQYVPRAVEAAQRTFVSSAAESRIRVDLPAIERFLASAGASNVKVPASLDGAEIRLDVPASVFTLYGSAGTEMMEGAAVRSDAPYLVLGQSRGPTLHVPESIDVNMLREQLLGSPVIPPDIARQLAAIRDWRQTLVIPVAPGRHRDVSVAGVPGLLIAHENRNSTLLYQKDGVVFAIMGNLGEDELMRVANSLR